MSRAVQEALFDIQPVRWVVASVLVCRGLLFMILGRRYRWINDMCRVVRIPDAGPAGRVARRSVNRLIDQIKASSQNPLVDWYRADPASDAWAAHFSLVGPGTQDIFRDLMVLKAASPREKGVILIKYARKFEAVVAMFDISRLMERYVFVLEPCWAGYCDPSILMFIAPGHPVVVQCFTEEDYRFIAEIGPPLVPIRLGPADWVDADLFAPSQSDQKPYDLVMVANWASHKRHRQLFRALNQIRDRKLRVLLVGFPWGGRTADDIRREARVIQHDLAEITILEKLPQNQLAAYLNQCRVFVFLSRKEGDNKALVEALFADVPAVVFDKTIGGARSRINATTGILSSDEELAQQITYMLNHHRRYRPREWALQHTGSKVATQALNRVIKQIMAESNVESSGDICEKMNAPNLAYKDEADRLRFREDYEFVVSCRRTCQGGRTGASAGRVQFVEEGRSDPCAE